MQNLALIIIDDDHKIIELIQYYIATYYTNIKVVGSATCLQEAVSLINSSRPDIVILDILLNTETGFDVLELTHEIDSQVIFISSYFNYTLPAFKYSPVDFLLKPIGVKELKMAINKAIERMSTKEEGALHHSRRNYIAVSSGTKVDILKTQDISHLEADGNYTAICLVTSKKIIACKNIGLFEKELPQDCFIRIHKRYIVNILHIKSIHRSDGYYCVLTNNVALSISRRKQERIHQILGIKN